MTTPDGSELVRISDSLGYGGLYAVRYCAQCEQRMNLIEDYEEQQSVCKFCRNGWERDQ